VTRPSGDDGPGARFTGRASEHGRVYQSGRDMQIGDRYEVDVDPTGPLFTGRGPGRALMVVGLCVVVCGFAGWASIVFGAATSITGSAGSVGSMSSFEPPNLLGPRLGSGMPLGIVYFLGFPFGGLLVVVGRSMAKAGARGGGLTGHLVTSVAVVAVGVLAVAYALGGSSPSALVPKFSGGTGEASGPPVVVSDAPTSATREGLTLTVVKVENTGGRGVVHLQAWNNTDDTVTLSTGWFVVTDGAGHTYKPNHFASDWHDDLGAKARQTGTITLDRPVALGTGTLRVEFTTLLGRTGPDAIAVSGIPSH